MKITLGEWKTRDGRKAIVAAENPDAHEACRLVGWVDGKSCAWRCDGLWHLAENQQYNADLIAPWTEPVPWDWSTTPPWINWIAMDSNGSWYMYDSEPGVAEKCWSFTGMSTHRIPKSHSPKWSGDWKLSKTQRPKEVAK